MGRKKKQTGCLSLLGGIFILLLILSALFRTSDKSSKQVKGIKESSGQPSPSAQLTETERQQIWVEFMQAQEEILQEVAQKYPDTNSLQTNRTEQSEYRDTLLEQIKETLLDKYHLTPEQLKDIQMEGLSKNWQVPIKWDISESARKTIFTEIYKADYTAQKQAELRFPENRAPISAESRSEYFAKKDKLNNALLNTKIKEIAQKYTLTRSQLDAIRKEGTEKQWASDIPVEILEPVQAPPEEKPISPIIEPQPTSSCSPKKNCSQMMSCQEARYHLTVCGNTELDRDNDGIPCENTVCQ